ncbi:MAG: RICIN domain-containing protein [Perlabentimonas sp.]
MKKILFAISILLLTTTLSLKAQVPTEMPNGKTFNIQSAMNYGKNQGGYWDIPGKPTHVKEGLNIQVWNIDNGHDRNFTLWKTSNGYYEIQIGNTTLSRVDIQGGKKDNGTSVKVWKKNNANNQQFKFVHQGNGRFKIFDRNSGKIICLAGRKNANGTNVHIWDNHNGLFTEWYLLDSETGRPFVPKAKANFAGWISSNNSTVIDGYLKDVSSGQLASDDNGSIKNAMNKLDATAQVNVVVTLMNSVLKNDDKKARKHIYTQLENVSYKKIPFLLKAVMSAHFSKFQEPDANLKKNVNAIQQKMNSAK